MYVNMFRKKGNKYTILIHYNKFNTIIIQIIFYLYLCKMTFLISFKGFFNDLKHNIFNQYCFDEDGKKERK